MSDVELHGFLEANPDAVIVVDPAGRITFASAPIRDLFGYLPGELVGRSLNTLIPERYRDRHSAHPGTFVSDPKPRMMGAGLKLFALRKDGTEFPAEISLSPHRTLDGLVVIAAIRDVSAKAVESAALEAENVSLGRLLAEAGQTATRLLERTRAEKSAREIDIQSPRLLLEELHHRVKNTLGVVASITSQSFRTAESLEQARSAIEGRLAALGRAHDMLLEASQTGATIRSVIRSAIEPFESHAAPRFIVQGADVPVGSRSVLPLTMSLNELCTNAVKYGALSNARGYIDITSVVDEEAQAFKLMWMEMGGPAVQGPTRRSFGTRLIETLAGQLHGHVRLNYQPAGLLYELDVPLAALQAVSTP